jgi:UDP-N-acetylmuramate dehydrogenase
MIPESLPPELRAIAPVRESEPLARHTTFGIGGPADLYLKVGSVDALVNVLHAAYRHRVHWFILGAGSNVLVGDRGIRGIVIEYDAKGVVAMGNGQWAMGNGSGLRTQDSELFRVEAGASFSQVARRLSREGYTGIEWAVGIPGTLGGAVVTNAGAYGGCLADTLVSVEVVEPGAGAREWPAATFALSYRESAITRGLLKNVAIAAVTLALRRDDPAATMARVARFDADRLAAQPAGRNVGSMFRNPPGQAAWRLIDAVGLRGARIGGAQVTHKHANFFANTGNARAGDVKALMDLAAARVREQFGIDLEPEVRLVGEGFEYEAPSPAARERGERCETSPDGARSNVSDGPASSASPLSRAAGEGPGEGAV